MNTVGNVALLLCIAMLIVLIPTALAGPGDHPHSKITCDKRSLSGGIAGASAGGDLWECWGGPDVSDLHDINRNVSKVRKAYQWCLEEPGDLRLEASMMVDTVLTPVLLPFLGMQFLPYAVVTVNLDAAECS